MFKELPYASSDSAASAAASLTSEEEKFKQHFPFDYQNIQSLLSEFPELKTNIDWQKEFIDAERFHYCGKTDDLTRLFRAVKSGELEKLLPSLYRAMKEQALPEDDTYANLAHKFKELMGFDFGRETIGYFFELLEGCDVDGLTPIHYVNIMKQEMLKSVILVFANSPSAFPVSRQLQWDDGGSQLYMQELMPGYHGRMLPPILEGKALCQVKFGGPLNFKIPTTGYLNNGESMITALRYNQPVIDIEAVGNKEFGVHNLTLWQPRKDSENLHLAKQTSAAKFLGRNLYAGKSEVSGLIETSFYQGHPQALELLDKYLASFSSPQAWPSLNYINMPANDAASTRGTETTPPNMRLRIHLLSWAMQAGNLSFVKTFVESFEKQDGYNKAQLTAFRTKSKKERCSLLELAVLSGDIPLTQFVLSFGFSEKHFERLALFAVLSARPHMLQFVQLRFGEHLRPDASFKCQQIVDYIHFKEIALTLSDLAHYPKLVPYNPAMGEFVDQLKDLEKTQEEDAISTHFGSRP